MNTPVTASPAAMSSEDAANWLVAHPTADTPAYQALAQTYTRLHRLGHLSAMASWDQAAFMPPKGNEARSAALAELATVMHRIKTDPALRTALERAQTESLNEAQRANLREIKRDWRASNSLPERLVEARSLTASVCEHAWRQQRPANDWAGFLPNLEAVVEVAREIAEFMSQDMGVSRYEALMDQFEPGLTTATVDRVFGEVGQWLPDLIQRIQAAQANETVLKPQGPFDVDQQRQLCDKAMHLLGFDFQAGRLDVSTHPFCGGVPEDVRMTTRFYEGEFLQSLMGTVHETGHGRYEQGLPKVWMGQPIAQARSMALHESQSLSFEMQLGASPGFIGLLRPMLVEQFGDQPAFAEDNLLKLFTRVKPGYIRVDADEATYPAHVILRYRIERALMEREIEARDIPAMWDEGMQKWLGIDTRGNFQNGPMQDVHWPSGMFGYFPCYSLGAMYAAQWFAAMRRDIPSLDADIASGQLSGAFNWLDSKIWSQGSRWTTDELAVRASGEPLNPIHFRRHLETRYLGSSSV